MRSLNALIDAFERYTGKTLPPGESFEEWRKRAGVRLEDLERLADVTEEPDEDGVNDDRLMDLDLAEPQLPRQGKPPAAWVAGQEDECSYEMGLLERYLDARGLTGHGWSIWELCRLPKGSGARPVAVPPSGLWPNIVPTLRVYEALRAAMGEPLMLRCYRPPDYNRAVKGASQSLHMWFAALDVYAPVDDRQALAHLAASVYLAGDDVWRKPATAMREEIQAIKGDLETLGLGIYGYPWPSNIHIDTGWRRRTWDDAKAYIDEVKQDA